MAAWDNVEGFEFQHDSITPSLDRQAACLSLTYLVFLPQNPPSATRVGEFKKGFVKVMKQIS